MIHRARPLPSLADVVLPIDGYIRVSRVGDRGGESYISPEIQRRALEAWALERDVELVLHEPEENVSGGTMDRPVFNRLMGRIRRGESGGLAVYKLDRFARTLVGGLTTLNELTELSALFASATEPLFDFTTADGRIFLQMNLMMAEYFRERAKESWQSSLTHAVSRGVHIAPGLPYGYRKDDGKRLVPDQAAPFVAQAYRRRTEGATYQAIADWLNAKAPPRHDGRPWIAVTVERMLRRRVYLGVAHWGEHENADAHPALVEHRLWRAAQLSVHHYSKRSQNGEIALLHGLIRCAGCRFLLSRATITSHGHSSPYYRCRRVRVSGVCAAPAMLRAARGGVETFVEDIVSAELERRAPRFVALAETRSLVEAMADLDAAREDLDAMRRDATARRRLGSQWLTFVEPLLDAVHDAERRVEQLQALESAPSFSGLTADAYRTLARDQRAAVLRAMIGCVFVRSLPGPRGRNAPAIDDRRVRILWRGQEPADLPGLNKVSPLKPWDGFDDEPPTGVAAS